MMQELPIKLIPEFFPYYFLVDAGYSKKALNL
jgi:hypothetical protein